MEPCLVDQVLFGESLGEGYGDDAFVAGRHLETGVPAGLWVIDGSRTSSWSRGQKVIVVLTSVSEVRIAARECGEESHPKVLAHGALRVKARL